LYTNDIPINYFLKLEMQLENYIYDTRRDESFHGLENLSDLLIKLIKTKRHIVYDMVYLLLKLVLSGDDKC
jgi:hypothetical protein